MPMRILHTNAACWPFAGGAGIYVQAMPDRLVTNPFERALAEIEASMRDGELQVDLGAHLIKTPLVGTCLTRFWSALHNLSLFYIRRLASKQAAINDVYGDCLLNVCRLFCQQHDEIEALNRQLAQLHQEGSQGGVGRPLPERYPRGHRSGAGLCSYC